MRILDRYIAKSFLVGYLISFFVLIGLRTIIDLFVNLDKFAKHADLGAWSVLRQTATYYGLNMTLYFRDIAGVIVVVAAAFSLGKMVRANELVAMIASGVSAKRIVTPILVLSALLHRAVRRRPGAADPVTQRPACAECGRHDGQGVLCHLVHDGWERPDLRRPVRRRDAVVLPPHHHHPAAYAAGAVGGDGLDFRGPGDLQSADGQLGPGQWPVHQHGFDGRAEAGRDVPRARPAAEGHRHPPQVRVQLRC